MFLLKITAVRHAKYVATTEHFRNFEKYHLQSLQGWFRTRLNSCVNSHQQIASTG